jgi:hypothetical protein
MFTGSLSLEGPEWIPRIGYWEDLNCEHGRAERMGMTLNSLNLWCLALGAKKCFHATGKGRGAHPRKVYLLSLALPFYIFLGLFSSSCDFTVSERPALDVF